MRILSRSSLVSSNNFNTSNSPERSFKYGGANQSQNKSQMTRQFALRKNTTKIEKHQLAIVSLSKKVDMVDQKMKNTKRTLNISKTLFGMVDEMDTTDFCA